MEQRYLLGSGLLYITHSETHHPEGRQTCCYHRQQAFSAAWLHSVQQSLWLLTRTSWRWHSKGKMNGHGDRDWYLSQAFHSPQILFPLSTYTLDICSKLQIKQKAREKGLFAKTKSSTQHNIPFFPDHKRERTSNAVTFRGVWSRMGMRDTVHKTMALFSQGSAELWWTHSNHDAPMLQIRGAVTGQQ